MYKALITTISSIVLVSPTVAVVVDPWIPGPFSTDGALIVNAAGQNLKYAGVNWPGSGETMVPEGLQYASIQNLVKYIKSIGMNTIRLTWAVEMVDNIFEHDGDVAIETAFTHALGINNGTKVFNAVMRNNPTFAPDITRLQVFDAIAQECAKQQVYLHLDNHVSKAGWCCGRDGNGWFGDTYFDVPKWKRALGYMAEHGRKTWPTFVSMSLRNELRQPSTLFRKRKNGWPEWYGNMTEAAAAIHRANPDLLIFFSGLELDTQLRPIFTSGLLGEKGLLDGAEFAYMNKIVLEVHDYPWNSPNSNCTTRQSSLTENALAAMKEPDQAFPVVMSEWGYAQTADQHGSSYTSCLREILPEKTAGWMIWVLAGSYYVRSGTQDYDEPYGLLNHEWKAWRCPDCVTGLGAMVKATLGDVK